VKIKDLIDHWERNAATPRTQQEYRVNLPLYTAAKLSALQEMYPGRTQEQLLTELLDAALAELSASFAYKAGTEIVSYDDQGDPIFEDEGLTPRFHQLSRTHAERLKNEDPE